MSPTTISVIARIVIMKRITCAHALLYHTDEGKSFLLGMGMQVRGRFTLDVPHLQSREVSMGNIAISMRKSLIFVVTVIGLGLAGQVASAGEPTVKELRRLSPEQLDQLFAQGRACELPVGAYRGTVLLEVEAHLPRVRARISSALWKGKEFAPDGDFTNRWFAGIRAVPSHAALETSWYDNQPCVALEYPPGSALFANTRDELREIAPGIWLGRFYERCPCPKLQGYFILEGDCCGRQR
jgi:hypothetical protein